MKHHRPSKKVLFSARFLQIFFCIFHLTDNQLVNLTIPLLKREMLYQLSYRIFYKKIVKGISNLNNLFNIFAFKQAIKK